jgi:hypothetical protein
LTITGWTSPSRFEAATREDWLIQCLEEVDIDPRRTRVLPAPASRRFDALHLDQPRTMVHPGQRVCDGDAPDAGVCLKPVYQCPLCRCEALPEQVDVRPSIAHRQVARQTQLYREALVSRNARQLVRMGRVHELVREPNRDAHHHD